MGDVNVWTNRLIGRDRELAALGSLLDEAVVDGATLLLAGEPGVGKTALLVAAAEMATNAGFEVIRGGGVEYETDVSFAGLHQLVGPLSDDLCRLPRSSRAAMEAALGIGPAPERPAPERLAVLNAALAVFRQAASRGPLLIVIDDLHWLDRASGAAVGFVGRRLRGSRIGLLGAIRPGVGGFFERAGLPEYEVAPLSQADAMGLLARQFVHLPTRVLRRVADEAQGNPLALLEFAASAGGRRDGGPRRTTVTSGMSREVRTLYDARIERLPEPTRRLLLLAVLDGSGDLGVLAAAAGPEGLDDLGPAERDHLIVVDDRAGELRFRHPMIKSVVVERSTHDERRATHLRLAERFADQPERRGHHLAEAAFAPDEEIAAAVEDGAHRTLQRGDVVGAISRLLRAADLSPNPADRSRRLADAAYVGAHSAGQLDSASELLHDAHRRDPTLGETLRATAATAYLLLNSEGDAETTHRLLTAAIESALGEPDQDRDGLSEVLYTLVLVCHYTGRTEYWVPFHDAMSRLGATAPTDVRLLAKTFADPVTAPNRDLPQARHHLPSGAARRVERGVRRRWALTVTTTTYVVRRQPDDSQMADATAGRIAHRVVARATTWEVIMIDYQDRWAVVTGASSGLGRGLAAGLADRGMSLALTGRNQARLDEAAHQIRRASPSVKVETVAADLSSRSGVSALLDHVGGRPIEVLVNNAGFGSYGPFAEADPDREAEELAVDVGTVVTLARAFLPGMLARGSGGILNVASTIAFQPAPYQAVYGANKAFVLSFSQALWAEARAAGVAVTALCPGPTRTGFVDALGADAGHTAIYRRLADPEPVIEAGLRAFDKGRAVVIPGVRNKAIAASGRFMPHEWLTQVSARLLRPASAVPRPPIEVHHEIVAPAGAERVWDLLTDVEGWPSWYRACRWVHVESAGSAAPTDSAARPASFRWKAHPIALRSTVVASDRPHSFAFIADARGLHAEHTFTLRPAPGGLGTVVLSHETQAGPLPRLGRVVLGPRLHATTRAWLTDLARAVHDGRMTLAAPAAGDTAHREDRSAASSTARPGRGAAGSDW